MKGKADTRGRHYERENQCTRRILPEGLMYELEEGITKVSDNARVYYMSESRCTRK